MLNKIFVVTDLGPGDGGKGGIVHALAQKCDASVVIKRGGAQGSHGVRTSRGESFNFSQWGCATFEGVPTYLSEQMVISPIGLKNEAKALARLGIYDPFVMLSCHPSCICATPYNRIASQLEELLRKEKPRGTIGSGIGQAYRMRDCKDITIRASELTDRKIVSRKLQIQRDFYRNQYAKVCQNDGLPDDAKLINDNLGLLFDDGYLPYCLDLFEGIGKKLRLEELSKILKLKGNAIVECSHGVLTDAETGLKPHVSAIRTLPIFTTKMLREAGYDGRIVNYAVHRAYEIRHGAGPMPSYDPKLTESMLPGSHKDNNRWQGTVRAGALDLNLLRAAFRACHETSFDGICITWFDQILANNRTWPICLCYRTGHLPDENYTEYLKRAKPVNTNYTIENPISKYALLEYVDDILFDYTKTHLAILSVGPTELDKIYSNKFKEENQS